MVRSPPQPPPAMGLYFSDTGGWAAGGSAHDSDDSLLDIVDLPGSDEPSMIAPSPATPWGGDLAGIGGPSGMHTPMRDALELAWPGQPSAGKARDTADNGHGFGEEARPRGEQGRTRDILQEWIEPLNHEYASAQDLLDAFSTTPPSISRAASSEPDHSMRQHVGNRSQADAVRIVPSLIGDHAGMVPPADRLSPFTCGVVFETPPAPLRDASRATKDVRSDRRPLFGGSSFEGVRSVTDDASSKLAHDLASKLAQRRAWEIRGGETKACDEGASAQDAGPTAPAMIPTPGVEDGPGHVSRMKELREHASGSSVYSGRIPAKTHSDENFVTRKCDDAATRRVSSAKSIFPSRCQQQSLHANAVVNGSDSLAGAESRLNRKSKTPDQANRCAGDYQTSSSVTVRILEAKMLTARRFGGLPDPCCWISLHHRSKKSNYSRRKEGRDGEVSVMDMKAQHTMRPHFKSDIVKQAQDPVWNSSTSLNVAYQCTSVIVDGIEHESATFSALSGQAVNLFLTVHDDGARHSFLGQAAICDILPGASVDRWVTLQRRDGSPQMDSMGRVSSVRVKIHYACTQTTSDSYSNFQDAKHPLDKHGPCDQGCSPKVQDHMRSKSPYTLRVSMEQQSSVETLQSVVRRMLSARVFRLTLLHSRLLRTELEGHNTGRRKLEVADDYKFGGFGAESASSSIQIAAEIITGASDYDATAFSNDRSLPQTDKKRTERQDMMDYALRNRSSLGQAEALLNLGLGLLDRNEFQEQARKYLDESWDLLQNMVPADLQHERACSLMQRLAKCRHFQDRPDLARRLSEMKELRLTLNGNLGMSARSKVACNEKRWPSPLQRLPLVGAEGLREKSNQKLNEQVDSDPDSLPSDLMTDARSELDKGKESYTPTSLELEKLYKSACKKSASRPETYRQLREMSIGEAAKAVRRKMSLSPTHIRSNQDTVVRQSQRSPSPSSPPALFGVCRPAEIIDLEESDDDSLRENTKTGSGPASCRGGMQVGQLALSRLIHSCDEFNSATQRKSAENDYRSENSHPKRMSTPSPSYRANGYVAGATVNLDRGTGKGKAQFVKPSSSKSSRLVILEAQLRALDAI